MGNAGWKQPCLTCSTRQIFGEPCLGPGLCWCHVVPGGQGCYRPVPPVAPGRWSPAPHTLGAACQQRLGPKHSSLRASVAKLHLWGQIQSPVLGEHVGWADLAQRPQQHYQRLELLPASSACRSCGLSVVHPGSALPYFAHACYKCSDHGCESVPQICLADQWFSTTGLDDL